MKRALLLVAAGCLLAGHDTSGGTPGPATLPRGIDVYFIENDLVYARFLTLRRDGTFQQINKDPTACAEVDGGTWEQANGIVRLHSVHHAMRPRALLAGPLCVVLDSPEKVAALSALATAAARFAESTEDRVFAASDVGEFSAPPLVVTLPTGAETFTRADLVSLVAQTANAGTAEQTGVYPLSILKTSGPTLLVPPDAVFGSK